MKKQYDRVESISSQSPNYPHTTLNFYINEQLVKRNFVDAELDTTEYFKNGKLHNEGEPAVIIKDDSGFQFQYYNEGKLNRKDGPAIEFVNYPKLNKWYLDGKELSSSEILFQKIKNIRDNAFPKLFNTEKNNTNSDKFVN